MVVGWSMAATQGASLVVQALRMSSARRPQAGLLQRSDLGSTTRVRASRRSGSKEEKRLMGEQMKVFFAACLYYSGLAKLARWWMQRFGQRLIILNFHRYIRGAFRIPLLY